MTGAVETLIVGGGISGLGCARRLHERGREFLLITDRLGGRMHHSADGARNFGATYITADYRHISRFVDRGRRFQLRDVYCENAGAVLPFLSWRTLRQARPLLRLVLRLRELRRALRRFRHDAEHTPQKDLLPRHPLIERYCKQPAGELIAELGLGRLHEQFFKVSVQTTLFVDPLRANALFYLAVQFPMIVPTWMADFTHTYRRLTEGFPERIRLDLVTALDRVEGQAWEVRTAGGHVHRARNVVLAAPYHNASRLYPVPRPHLSTTATVLFVCGRRRAPYRNKRFLGFHPEQTGITLAWQLSEDHDQVFSLRPDPDLTAIYESHEVLDAVTWKEAIIVSDADWAPMQLEANLFLVGDYNLCGLEDSYITGLCAANAIIKETRT